MSDSYSETYRPKTVKQLIGDTQRAVCEVLLKKAENGNIVQEVMFSGSSGIGKTTIARIYCASLINDLSEVVTINCSAETGIDMIREAVIGKMYFLPMGSKYKVYFLDEIHGLSKQAQNALLTEIEPLPKHVIMIVSTTEPNKIIPTLRSRFTEYRLSVPDRNEFRKKRGWILYKAEQTLEQVGEAVTEEIIDIANGNVRTFDRYMQQLVEGSYKGMDAEGAEAIFPKKLIIEGMTMQKSFVLANKSSKYDDLARWICNYSIKVLQNNSGGKVKDRAEKALDVFGENIFLTDKIMFFNRLLRFHKEK